MVQIAVPEQALGWFLPGYGIGCKKSLHAIILVTFIASLCKQLCNIHGKRAHPTFLYPII